MTNSGSNSAGSDTAPFGLLDAVGRRDCLAGDSAREEGFLAGPDGGGEVRTERCLACSSAILESIAPFRRFQAVSKTDTLGWDRGRTWNMMVLADPTLNSLYDACNSRKCMTILSRHTFHENDLAPALICP